MTLRMKEKEEEERRKKEEKAAEYEVRVLCINIKRLMMHPWCRDKRKEQQLWLR